MSETADELILTPEAFHALASGEHDDPDTASTLEDEQGRPVLAAGQAQAPYEGLVSAYRTKRAMFLIDRADGRGQSRRGYVWWGPEGCLSADQPDDGSVRIKWESSVARFRVLIDLLGLGDRPVPEVVGDPIQLKATMLEQLADDEPQTATAARTDLSDKAMSISPDIAQSIAEGNMEMVSLVSEWDSPQGNQTGGTVWIDTPSGVLLHSTERALLRQRHLLEPAPSWLLWSRAVEALPSPDIFDWWNETS